ncbi:hypothetical protein AMATHDRAFT_59715 [Amanita thiersii Skay4041]|uniref:Uncharacterized protein n=1 Tax=Amanita thiersii Skay4041 TaxID=703135 RepID=A0A2A9NSD5_9AGAR|nr:hypothetical protein AMATHDRAFT_59715 [Amanita thiersii Skay4041]
MAGYIKFFGVFAMSLCVLMDAAGAAPTHMHRHPLPLPALRPHGQLKEVMRFSFGAAGTVIHY